MYRKFLMSKHFIYALLIAYIFTYSNLSTADSSSNCDSGVFFVEFGVFFSCYSIVLSVCFKGSVKYLCWCLVVKLFSWSVVEGLLYLLDDLVGECV